MFDSMSVPSALKRHMHNEYELYFFLQGNVDYTLGSSLYHLNAGDMLFIRPTVFHFPKILSKLRELGKTQYLLVEQDDCYGEDPFDCLRRSYDHIQAMGY